jgi:hypothetical protein
MTEIKNNSNPLGEVTLELDILIVTLDLTGKEEYAKQLIQYVKIYDIFNYFTLLNLEAWTKARKIPFTFQIKWWKPRGFLLWVLYKLAKYYQKDGVDVMRPEKWKDPLDFK